MKNPASRLDRALHYASQGFAVFPLHSVRNRTCSCGKVGCKKKGKHPRTAHGHLDATTDEAQIRRWWSEFPGDNIGIRTGRRSNLFVLDLDNKSGADLAALLAQITRMLGVFPRTVIVVTGSGGLHLWFRMPPDGARIPCSQKRVAPNADIRGDGGYVVAPGSIHVSGREYAFVEGLGLEEVPIADAPDELVLKSRAGSASRVGTSSAPTYVPNMAASRLDALAARPLSDDEREETVQIIAAVWPRESGLRHSLAMALAHVLKVAGVPVDDVPDLVGEIASAAGDEDEVSNGDRSKAAFDALLGDQGYGWPFLRMMAPELCDALRDCPAVARNVPVCMLEDLDDIGQGQVVSQEEARTAIREALGSAAIDVVTGVAASPGAGKSVASADVAVERARRGQKTGIVVSEYKQLWSYSNALNRAGGECLILISPAAKDDKGNPFCDQVERVEPLVRSGWPVRRTTCAECPTRRNCPARRGRIGNNNAPIVLSTHQQVAEVTRLIGPTGLLIVDEAVAIWESDFLSRSALRSAVVAAQRVLRPSCKDKPALIAMLKAIEEFAATREPGATATIPEVLGEILEELKEVEQADLMPDMAGDGATDDAASLGKVMKRILPGIENPDLRLEVVDSDGGGLVIHGPDLGLMEGFRSVTAPMVFLDANLEVDEVRKIAGKPVREIRLSLPDSAPVTRTVVVNFNGLRKYMLAGGRPTWKNITGPLRDAVLRAEVAAARSVLIVTYKPVAEAMKELQQRRAVPADKDARRIQDLLRDLEEPIDGPGRNVYIEHYPLKGTNAFETVDMVVTLGDAWDNKGAASFKAKWLGLPSDRMYRKWARAQLGQAHGRARPGQRDKPLTCMHYGTVVPDSWTVGGAEGEKYTRSSPAPVIFARLPLPGRPKKLTPAVLEKIGTMVRSGKTSKEISAALEISVRSVQAARAEITNRENQAVG